MKKALAALLFCLVPSSALYPESRDLRIFATPLPIDPVDPARRDFGRLRYLGGWHLTSGQANFGGYSALSVEGDQFLALADTGDFMRFRMVRPGVISESSFGTLPMFPGGGADRHNRDPESMTTGPEGDVWVGFENQNAIVRYNRDLSEFTAMAWPPAMLRWPRNSGAESLARLEGGRFVAIEEGVTDGKHVGLMFPGDPTNPKNVPFTFTYRPPAGYWPTDAQQLPDGRLVVLNRHFGLFDGFWAAVTIVDIDAIQPGALVSGELIAEFKPPLNIDNMEGISPVREGNKTVLWLISDDNKVRLERTLLLKFELMDE